MPSITTTCNRTRKVSVTGISNVEQKSYSVFTFTDGDTYQEYKVNVYPSNPYRVIWYDATDSKVMDVTGEITEIGSNCLYLESIRAIDSSSCLCESREYLNKLITIYRVAIPIRNIYGIYEIKEEEIKAPPKPPRPKERSVTIVGVLGLSAEIVKSIVVRIRVYDDDRAPTYEAIPVDMKVGNIYNISYFSRNDGSMYEIKGKLIDIELMPKYEGDTKLNGYVRDEMPEEVVGMGNTIYDADHFHCLNKESPEGERIRFKFDTSEDHMGYYDHVWLKDIRNVDLIGEEESDDNENEGEEITNNCPHAATCPIVNNNCNCPDEPHHPPHYHPVPPPPCHCDEDPRDYPCTAPWDRPMAPPPPPPVPPMQFIYCPKTAMPITEKTNCGDCDQLDDCQAFEDYTNRTV